MAKKKATKPVKKKVAKKTSHCCITGQSNTGQSNTGQSNTGQSGKDPLRSCQPGSAACCNRQRAGRSAESARGNVPEKSGSVRVSAGGRF